MNARVENTLLTLANRHAPHLLTPGWNRHLDRLARQLAEHDLLVLMAELPHSGAAQTLADQWLRTYAHLYEVLAKGAFPTFATFKANYVDRQLPVIVVLEGQATAVIEAMAGFIVPYIGLRQKQTALDDEIRYLVHVVLMEQLMCDELPRARFNQLAAEAFTVIRELLALPVQHVALTGFDRPVFNIPAPAPTAATPPPRPTSIPAPPSGKLPTVQSQSLNGHKPEPKVEPPPSQKLELPRLDEAESPSERLSTSQTQVPLPNSNTRRLPPVPKLPEDKNK